MVGAVLRNPDAVRTDGMWREVEGAKPYADGQVGDPMADGLDRPSEEPGAALKVSSERAGPVDARQQFVDQVAVAGLDVDEREAGVMSDHRRFDEIV